MKINEVEKRVGISKANIRYYEKQGLNKSIGVLVISGLIVNIIAAFFLGSAFTDYEGEACVNLYVLLCICLVIGIASYLLMNFTANKVALSVIYIVNVLMLTPFIAVIYQLLSITTHSGQFSNTQFSNSDFALFWVFVLVYVILIYMISISRSNLFRSVKIVLVVAVVYSVAAGCIMSMLMGYEAATIIMLAVLNLYMSLCWFNICNDKSEYTSYYAIVESIRMLNLFGVFISMRGRQTLKGRRYDG